MIRVLTDEIERDTSGAGDLIDITDQIHSSLSRQGLSSGIVTVFVIGSTAGITTFEYESGLIEDMREFYERTAPSDRSYAHDMTWQDNNGFSHIRAAMQGQSLSIPFTDGRLILGTWQQVVLAEFDHRPRQRRVVLKFIGQ